MNVELINDQEPRGVWIRGKRLGDMPRKVFFGPAWPYGGRHDFPRCYIEIGDQTLRPRAKICILGTLDQAWPQGQGGGSTLQRLDPGLLIRTEDMPPCSAMAGAFWLTSHTVVTCAANATGSSGLALSQYSTRWGCKSA